jgi:hypothetical protein
MPTPLRLILTLLSITQEKDDEHDDAQLSLQYASTKVPTTPLYENINVS